MKSAKSVILTVNQLSEVLNCSPASIYKQVYRKKLPFRKMGGKIVFIRSEIDRFLEELPGLSLAEALVENTKRG